MNEVEKMEVKAKLQKMNEERDAIIAGKSRITQEEENRYNKLGMDIIVLGRKLY